jgi:glutathione S-transferase
MADLKLYTNPMSRGRVVRWMLEETGAPYEAVIVPYGENRSPAYLALNPMGKLPTLTHGKTVVTEVAAICAYLADAFHCVFLRTVAGRECCGVVGLARPHHRFAVRQINRMRLI